MLLLIDNYDSFTYNLVHYFGELGKETVVKRNDEIDVQTAMGMGAEAIILSPGPCDPAQAGICLALTAAAAETKTPLVGVCLGHQTIGETFGGRMVPLWACPIRHFPFTGCSFTLKALHPNMVTHF